MRENVSQSETRAVSIWAQHTYSHTHAWTVRFSLADSGIGPRGATSFGVMAVGSDAILKQPSKVTKLCNYGFNGRRIFLVKVGGPWIPSSDVCVCVCVCVCASNPGSPAVS